MKQLNAWLCAAGMLILPCLSGCGGSGTTTNQPIVDPSPHSVAAVLPNGLTATLAEDRSRVAVGGVVTYTLALANNTAQPITYQPVVGGAAPSGGIPASLLVKDSQGNTAFPLGAIAQFISIGPSTALTPGQSVSGILVVGDNKDLGQFPAAGQYTANAVFTVQTGQDSDSQTTTTVGPLTIDVP